MNLYLYRVVTNDGRRYTHYKLEYAVEYLKENGGRLYAVTKNLYPSRALLMWA